MRKIIHVDMDAFYASIEQRDHPEYQGKPVAVGYSGDRGVVAAASYEARKYGVHSAMASKTAKRKCPQLIFLPTRFAVYKRVSRHIRNMFYEYTDLVEPLSLDEAYLDVTVNKKGIASATTIAKELKKRIKDSTGLTASAGVSINKFLAKVASDYKKPDGLFVITDKKAEAFVESLKIEAFWGVGKVTAEKMRRLGIYTGKDLKMFSEAELVRRFGKAGHTYYLNARAIDNRPVEAEREHKSMGAETTFLNDLTEPSDLKEALNKVAAEVWRRITKNEFNGRTVALKIKYSDFRQITRSKTLSSDVENYAVFQNISLALLDGVINAADFKGRKIRLLGLTIGNPKEELFKGQLEFEFE